MKMLFSIGQVDKEYPTYICVYVTNKEIWEKEKKWENMTPEEARKVLAEKGFKKVGPVVFEYSDYTTKERLISLMESLGFEYSKELQENT